MLRGRVVRLGLCQQVHVRGALVHVGCVLASVVHRLTIEAVWLFYFQCFWTHQAVMARVHYLAGQTMPVTF